MLALHLIKYGEGVASAEPKTRKTIYFFCTAENRRNSGIAILRGLIYQLLQDEEMYKHIADKYSTYGAMLFEDEKFEALWSAFESMVHQPNTNLVTCILDGLDECGKDLLSDFWVKVRALFDPATQRTRNHPLALKMIIISRNNPDSIEQALENFTRLRLEPALQYELRRDVERFIEDRMKELQCSERRRPDLVELRGVVKQKLSEKANGTYLWAGFAIKALREERCVDLEDALDRFPSGLHAVYQRMIENVRKEKQDVVISILRWITFATRPLTLTELGVTTYIKPARGQDFEAAVEDYLAYAGDLITIGTPLTSILDQSREKQKTALPVHSSLTDYLITAGTQDSALHKFHLDLRLSHGILARMAMEYVLDVLTVTAASPEKNPRQFYNEYPLYQYALEAGLQHFLESYDIDERLRFDHALFDKTTAIHSQWLTNQSCAITGLKCPEDMTLAYLAALLGHVKLLGSCVGTDAVNEGATYTVDVRDANGRTPYFYATFNNKAEATFHLEKQGANFATTDVLGQCPLHIACGQGHESFVRALLETPGVDAGQNSSSMIISVGSMLDQAYEYDQVCANSSGTPLHLAAWNGQVSSLKMLLSEDLDINARDDRQQTALHRAALAEENSVKSCELLLSKGVDHLAYDREGQTAFHSAWGRSSSPMDILELMIEKGIPIDVLTKGGNQMPLGMSALLLACEDGRDDAVDLLMDRGADVSRRDSSGRNALHWLCTLSPLTPDAVDRYNTLKALFGKLSVDDIVARDSAGQSPHDLAVIQFRYFVSQRKQTEEDAPRQIRELFTKFYLSMGFAAFPPLLNMWENLIKIPHFSESVSESNSTETAYVTETEFVKCAKIAGVEDHLLQKRTAWNRKEYPTPDDIPNNEARHNALVRFLQASEKAAIYTTVSSWLCLPMLRFEMYEADMCGTWDDFVEKWRGKGVVLP
jgi:ankyrin repeat protein